MIRSIPQGFHTITPSIIVKDTKKAIEFYKRAFGATENGIFVGPNGKIMHAEIQIGDSKIMMCDEMLDMGALSVETLKGSPVSLWIYTENADAMYERAVKAGAKSKMPPADMFWGDRFGAVIDPFGYTWSIAVHKEDLSPSEIKQRAEAFFSRQSTCAEKK